jgi:HlyD family secretion protein
VKVPAAALRWSPPDPNARPTIGPGGPPGMGGGFGGPGGGQRQQGGQGGGQRGMMGARIVQELELNAAQQKQWEAIQAETRQKIQAAMASAGGDRSQMREAMRKVQTEAFARLEPSLKPEQKTKLAALRATLAQSGGRGSAGLRPGTVYVLKDGKPSAVPVRVGATDGTSTEVVGQLKPGDQVITGGGPKPKAQVRSPFGGGQNNQGGGGGRVQVKM